MNENSFPEHKIICRDLARILRVKPFVIIGELMGMNIFVPVNHHVPANAAALLCRKAGESYFASVFERWAKEETDRDFL